eukprot:TRINITY_DN8820_c0_g2_i1.p1 TRINITY_DN8820_c0_g2~~TRINITY_DN8820_c0_g2_i1.p1  ORF type:complete len:257 (-),score=34.16 TRINITY_DN8820_c0_g2_i1:96-866(-)
MPPWASGTVEFECIDADSRSVCVGLSHASEVTQSLVGDLSETVANGRNVNLRDCSAGLGGEVAEKRWSGRLSRSERARHAILSWRLQRPYMAYCLGCAGVTFFLLVWNFAKGVQNNWNLPQWKHHVWEEVLEVTIGVAIVVETMLTMRVVGVRDFLGNMWCVFDLVVAVLTAVSVGYGLKHLGRRGEICEADVPLLLLRFILQPARVLAAVASTCRTRQMQTDADELTVDFDALPGGAGVAQFGLTASFEEMVDIN